MFTASSTPNQTSVQMDSPKYPSNTLGAASLSAVPSEAASRPQMQTSNTKTATILRTCITVPFVQDIIPILPEDR